MCQGTWNYIIISALSADAREYAYCTSAERNDPTNKYPGNDITLDQMVQLQSWMCDYPFVVITPSSTLIKIFCNC